MIALDASVMYAVAPRFSGDLAARQKAIVSAVGSVLDATLTGYDIHTTLRAAHFLAQTCHESAGFRTTQEFADGDAYEGRTDLGNTQPGDGKRYKGRGLLQLTGRANYAAYGPSVGADLVADPDKAADPVMSLKIACEFWTRHKLNQFADADDIDTITRRINGGLNGLADRKARLIGAKLALNGGKSVPPAQQPTLRLGDSGPAVSQLQQQLTAHGFKASVDGVFGPGTERTVKLFQVGKNLGNDGIAGRSTWAALA
jgi:putative chitinase